MNHDEMVEKLRRINRTYDLARGIHFEIARAADLIEAQAREGAGAVEALAECEDYFDNRADADCDQDGFIPNKEMLLLSVVRRARSALESGPAGLADAPSEIATLRKERDEAREALRECQSALAMMVSPGSIQTTSTVQAYAAAMAAEVRARSVLSPGEEG
ncbi:hypothetical protein BOSEA31B_10427 [Hyphomicrobiales bacterium]|nr:hypothetical protein BOSEA31B_10427 [Hyphomicrobiales bacterium]CAH1702109.1 hypothetical protein BOSEA1005_21808 [Hyphomicrobiales bacterium]CAI0346265.1 hypothetical protein BO1005MUT1_490077 [Hyphomicrobiales bacterium]